MMHCVRWAQGTCARDDSAQLHLLTQGALQLLCKRTLLFGQLRAALYCLGCCMGQKHLLRFSQRPSGIWVYRGDICGLKAACEGSSVSCIFRQSRVALMGKMTRCGACVHTHTHLHTQAAPVYLTPPKSAGGQHHSHPGLCAVWRSRQHSRQSGAAAASSNRQSCCIPFCRPFLVCRANV